MKFFSPEAPDGTGFCDTQSSTCSLSAESCTSTEIIPPPRFDSYTREKESWEHYLQQLDQQGSAQRWSTCDRTPPLPAVRGLVYSLTAVTESQWSKDRDASPAANPLYRVKDFDRDVVSDLTL